MKKAQTNISVLPQFPAYAGYAAREGASVLLRNDGTEEVTLTVKVWSDVPLLIPFEEEVTVPALRTVRLSLDVFSPEFLAACPSPTPVACHAEGILSEKEVIAENFSVTALPFDWWEGAEGDAARLARFVRPRLPVCAELLARAEKRLRVWGAQPQRGYAGGREGVRRTFAAVYAAIKETLPGRRAPADCTRPLSCSPEPAKEGATAMELAVLACSVLEADGLHPVLAVGEREVGVGVWLCESCLLDCVTEETEVVEEYCSAGVDHLAFFDADDLFSDKKGAFSVSSAHFSRKLAAGKFLRFADIKRCRLSGIFPAAARGEKGELLKGEELFDAAPAPLPERDRPPAAPRSPLRKWERRLLDLTSGNPLLSFSGAHSLHLVSADADETLRSVDGEMRLLESEDEAGLFADMPSSPRCELIRLEGKNHILRTYRRDGTTLVRLMRKSREAEEETGAHILYLSFGLLRYPDGKAGCAPLLLLPVSLKRSRKREEFTLSRSGELCFNETLSEYLRREFGVDLSDVGEDLSACSPSAVFSLVRARLPKGEGWKIFHDVYLSAFSFGNFLLWRDLKTAEGRLSENPLLSALLEGRPMKFRPSVRAEDEVSPEEHLLPLPYDSSQFSAIEFAGMGASFVLHGPPGTGKSQTIANIIADALYHGKRVLFVAEKRAALEVVKKRLDGVGIGEFCLALYGDRAERESTKAALARTLDLGTGKREISLFPGAKELMRRRQELLLPLKALHEKRRMGLSVHEAVLGYLKNRGAPDILGVSPAFYETLSREKFSSFRNTILSAAAAAKECGKIGGSPFEGIGLSEYSPAARDRLQYASEALGAECRHTKAVLSMVSSFLRQRMPALTEDALREISLLSKELCDGKYDRYFSGTDEEEFSAFYAANRRLDACLSYYYKHFGEVVAVDPSYAASIRSGGDWRLIREAKAAAKKLCRAALHPVSPEDMPKFLVTAADIAAAEETLEQNPLSKPFLDRGRLNLRRRREFLAELDALHGRCARLFPDYSAEAFNGMCLRAKSARPLLQAVIRTTESFFSALGEFLKAARSESAAAEDLPTYYAEKTGALLDNLDMLPHWCMYQKSALGLRESGLSFLTDALARGTLSPENLLSGFEKSVYRSLLESVIPSEPLLSLTDGIASDREDKFRAAEEQFVRTERVALRERLLGRLQNIPDEERTLLAKSGNAPLRSLFGKLPALLSRAAPCMLMSPTTVARYLAPKADMFDLVIFDEASQMTTAEAAGGILRGRAAVIAGDPNQLPPTSFFRPGEPEEDAGSFIEDCLSIGLPSAKLTWHYRSRHESLIAFSNSMYYANRLCTFPSTDTEKSKVRLFKTDGVYDRGGTKRNRREAELLIREVIRRLKDPVLSRLSMGIVTFSAAQQEELSRMLAEALKKEGLTGDAGEEPLFVKNLENVQGDERDVILISVCYGPDSEGKVSLNLGPLNRTDGWRRLNVAVSRAREEMILFSSMRPEMIDLERTSSEGVRGLRSLLEFAEQGRRALPLRSEDVKQSSGIGTYLAREIEALGFRCRTNVGMSDFRIDAAVIDPKDPNAFLLGVLGDGESGFSAKDRTILQPQILKRGGWNLMRVSSVAFFSNPKREIRRIRETLDRLTGTESRAGTWLKKYSRQYRRAGKESVCPPSVLTDGRHDAEIRERLEGIVSAEEPLSRGFLRKRCLQSFGIRRVGMRTERYLDEIIDSCAFRRERAAGSEYFYRTERATGFSRVRIETEEPVRRAPEDVAVFDVLALVKGALEEHISLYLDELIELVSGVFGLRQSEGLAEYVSDCVAYGEQRGLLLRSVSDRVTLR